MREEILEFVAERLDGHKPILATVFGDTVAEQIKFLSVWRFSPIRKNKRSKVGVLLLRNYRRGRLPCGDQERAEFLNFRLSNQNLSALANDHDNFAIAIFEYTSVNLETIA